MTRRNFHHKPAGKSKKLTAGEDAVARGVATIFTTAAARVLAARYGWTVEQTTTFGDELIAEAAALAEELNRLGRAGTLPARPPEQGA